MNTKQFPVIDPIATGKNIIRLRVERGMSVRDLQAYFGFEEPQAIYKWQQGKSLPSVDNLYALGALFEVPSLFPQKQNLFSFFVPCWPRPAPRLYLWENCSDYHGYGRESRSLRPFLPRPCARWLPEERG